MALKELTIVARDRTALLADVSAALARAHINIHTIFVDVSRKNALINLVLNEKSVDRAVKLLRKKKFRVFGSDVIVVRVKNRPGELSKLCRLLADNGVGISNVHTLKLTRSEGIDAIQTSDNALARKLLRKHY